MFFPLLRGFGFGMFVHFDLDTPLLQSLQQYMNRSAKTKQETAGDTDEAAESSSFGVGDSEKLRWQGSRHHQVQLTDNPDRTTRLELGSISPQLLSVPNREQRSLFGGGSYMLSPTLMSYPQGTSMARAVLPNSNDVLNSTPSLTESDEIARQMLARQAQSLQQQQLLSTLFSPRPHSSAQQHPLFSYSAPHFGQMLVSSASLKNMRRSDQPQDIYSNAIQPFATNGLGGVTDYVAAAGVKLLPGVLQPQYPLLLHHPSQPSRQDEQALQAQNGHNLQGRTSNTTAGTEVLNENHVLLASLSPISPTDPELLQLQRRQNALWSVFRPEDGSSHSSPGIRRKRRKKRKSSAMDRSYSTASRMKSTHRSTKEESEASLAREDATVAAPDEPHGTGVPSSLRPHHADSDPRKQDTILAAIDPNGSTTPQGPRESTRAAVDKDSPRIA